jgi:hypothetical protein
MEAVKPYLGYALWAILIIAGLVVFLVLWKAFSQRVRGRRGHRLGISEYRELDQTHRLVLVRRDNVEHLLLIGGPTDIVVESGIGSGTSGYGQPASDLSGDTHPIPLRPAPRAPGFGERRGNVPPPPRQDPPLREPPILRDPTKP